MSTHPDWCAADHRCGLGEHRSEPQGWRAPYGTILGTRVAGERGQWLEVRLSVRLPADARRAEDLCRWLLVGVDLAVRMVTLGQLGWVKSAYARLGGVRVR